MWDTNHTTSSDGREAISRAARAVVRLAVDPDAKEPALRQNVVVNNVDAFTDREAWDAVAALEHMTLSRGLVSAEQVEDERRAAAVAVLMGEEVN